MQVSFNSQHLPPASVSAADVWLEISTWVNAELITVDMTFAHHASNCQVMGLPLCFGLTDSSHLTTFIEVETLVFVTCNWNIVSLTGGPGPWLAATRRLSFFVWKTMEPLWWIIYSHSPLMKMSPLVLSNQHVLRNSRCVFNQLMRENYLSRAVKRANFQVCRS